MLSWGIVDKGKNISVSKNSFPYSADAKPTANKNQFDFVYCLLSLFVPIDTTMSMSSGT